MRRFHSHVSFEQMNGKYTKDEWVMLLTDFQDEIIRDYRARFSDALINRKYFTKSLELTAKEAGIDDAPEFTELKQGLDDTTRCITRLRNDVIGKERATRAFSRTLPGEELFSAYGVTLQDGRDEMVYDAVVITPYAAFSVTFTSGSGTLDEHGFLHVSGSHSPAENIGFVMQAKELRLRRKLRKYRDLPVYSMLLVTDNNARVKDEYGKVVVSKVQDVLSDIRMMSDGRRHITPEESCEIREMLIRSSSLALIDCPVDLKRAADGYAWFVAKCTERSNGGLLGRIRSIIQGKPAEKPEAEIA